MRLCARNDVVVTWVLVVREASTFFDAPQSPGEGQVFFSSATLRHRQHTCGENLSIPILDNGETSQ